MSKEIVYKEDDLQRILASKTAPYLEKIEKQQHIIDEQAQKLNIINSQINEYKAKDSTISLAIISAIEKAQQIESSSKKLYQLEIERIRLLYLKMDKILKQLYINYPQLKSEKEVNSIMERVEAVIDTNPSIGSTESMAKYSMQSDVDEPIKNLLNKITTIFDSKDSKKIILKRKDSKSQSGFDLKEALNPTQQLSEIMKAFNLDTDNPKDESV